MKKKIAIAALAFLFFSLVVPVLADTEPGSLDAGFDPGTGLDSNLPLNLSVRAMTVTGTSIPASPLVLYTSST